MYIENTTNNVMDFCNSLEKINDLGKMKTLLYIFNGVNNNQVNDKNIINIDLEEVDDAEIFNFENIGLSANYCTMFLQYNISVLNGMINDNKVYEENGNVIGITYDTNEKKLISKFEKLSFKEKIDVICEIFIRYENETYFQNKIATLDFISNLNGFDIAKSIMEYKNNIK